MAHPSRTETPDDTHAELDRYDTARLVAALVDDHAVAVRAVQAASQSIAHCPVPWGPMISIGC